MSFATRAAIELQLGTDATALSTQALDIATVTVGDYSDRFNHGAALALDGDPRGLPIWRRGHKPRRLRSPSTTCAAFSTISPTCSAGTAAPWTSPA